MVAQQASGEYIHIVDHLICSTSDEVSSSLLVILVTSHIHDAINKLSCNVVDSKSLMVSPVP